MSEFEFKPIEVEYANTINIDESCPPFDGKPVLIKIKSGVVEASWLKVEVNMFDGETGGFYFLCLDGDADDVDLDEVLGWCPIPPDSKEAVANSMMHLYKDMKPENGSYVCVTHGETIHLLWYLGDKWFKELAPTGETGFTPLDCDVWCYTDDLAELMVQRAKANN